jgi:hypothetical protein
MEVDILVFVVGLGEVAAFVEEEEGEEEGLRSGR